MADVVFVVVTLIFFAVAGTYGAGCDGLNARPNGD